jgi:hypothetical protein
MSHNFQENVQITITIERPIHREIQKMKDSSITRCPQHEKQDKEKAGTFSRSGKRRNTTTFDFPTTQDWELTRKEDTDGIKKAKQA